MAKKTLSSAQIQNYLTIPLGIEDEQDSSGAESDDDIAVIRSSVNKLCETFSDTDDEEESVSLNRYESASPLSGSCGSDMQQHISNPSSTIPDVPSTSRSNASRTHQSTVVSSESTMPKDAAPTPAASVFRKKRNIIWKKTTFHPTNQIYAMRTVNKGRLGKTIQIPSMKDLKSSKKERGYSEEWVGNVNGTDIVTVMWYDNKPVVLTSSFVEKEPTQKVRRFC
ncbi:unnamed protein product [Parnassius apollo]|uniref:(apollo) hypothetical protein n=1 Tax=Parnassius apollo TaxID=110799 RepID=A0A8S3XCA9_PARAO|nr:unnamed protein product [Parnassius apollo]